MQIQTVVGGVTKLQPEKLEAYLFSKDNLYISNCYQVPYVEGGTNKVEDTENLTKRIVLIENDKELTIATEYWSGENLRHRSVKMQLKQGLELVGNIGSFL